MPKARSPFRRTIMVAARAANIAEWREEVIWRAEDNRSISVYTTPHFTARGITTLMHDPTHRLSVAWQNVAYNQPPHTGYFLGAGMKAADGLPLGKSR